MALVCANPPIWQNIRPTVKNAFSSSKIKSVLVFYWCYNKPFLIHWPVHRTFSEGFLYPVELPEQKFANVKHKIADMHVEITQIDNITLISLDTTRNKS